MTLSYDKVRFVLFFPSRTGSTYLIEALDSHPEICAGKEFLRRRYDADKQLQAVRKYFTQPSYKQYSAIGFKTKLRVVRDPERLAKLLREVRARVILMLRRNVVKLTVSSLNADRLRAATQWDDIQKWNWNLYDEQSRLPPASIDVTAFSRRMGDLEFAQRELESYVEHLQLPTLRLYYEDLLIDERTIFARVISFLEVQPKPLQGRTLKNTGDDLREVISNFDELRSHYLGAPYEQMFDEVLISK